ncbi:MAG: ABC-2 family transporter protein [Anaerolineae bacterium]
MNRLMDIYQQQFKVTLAIQLQYRVGLAIWMIYIILNPVIYLVVWQSAAGDGELAGYGAQDFAAYFIVLLVVTHFTDMWHMWTYEYLIREGQMSMRLVRPLHPIHVDIIENLSNKFLMSFVVLPAVILLSLVFQPRLEPPLWAIPAFVLSLLTAGALQFLTGWVVAMAAFWTTRIIAINEVYFLAVLIFSGQFAPLDLLPAPLPTIANLLPFRWVIAFPVELLLGRLTVEQAVMGFGAQLFWLAVVLVLWATIWKAAVRRYSAVGG